jgi:PIN domain nuclease of toxin-antitoxin system
MRLLLDTHTFLWYYSGSAELSETARMHIENAENEYWVSIASLWEISIKHSIGKLDLDKSFDEFCVDVVGKGFIFLPIEMAHVMKASKLPFYNRDPFDRIIVAQAITENLDFVTRDDVMEMYLKNQPIKIIW